MTSGDSAPGWPGPRASHPASMDAGSSPLYVPVPPAPPTSAPPAPPASAPPAGAPVSGPAPAPFPATATVPARGQVYLPAGYPYPVSAPAGYGWPTIAYPLPSPTRPPARHSPLRWLVVVACALFIVAFGGIGAVVGISDLAGLNRTVAAWRTPAAAVAAPPAANAPTSEWTDWARRAVDSALRDQGAALLAADETRYLASADPGNTELVADLKRRFTVLSRMGLGQWSESLRGLPRSTGDRTWDADVKISYCFGDKSCHTVGLVVHSQWEYRADHLLMVALQTSDSDQLGPRPWETDDLAIGNGDRVVVAASKSDAWRVPDAVVAADRAAKVADTLAKWEPPPSRYVIFLAGPDDWTRWYGHDQPEWAAAWAVPVSNTVTEVMVRTQAVQQRGLEQLLTHELTHVTTLAGNRDGATRNAWWLIEGIADYATMIGKPVGQYDALTPTRAFVRGRWDGNPAVDPPTAEASLEEASGRYGVAFLAVRRIADVYGQDKMLAFFGSVVHDNQTAENAAPQVLGADWATVKADCARFIRQAGG